jgi:hypothetical protein
LVSENDFEFHIHPNYEQRVGDTIQDSLNRTSHFDIAMIVLKNAINENEPRFKPKNRQIIVNTICLPESEMLTDEYVRPATFFGWGRIGNHTKALKLQRGDVEVRHGLVPHCLFPFCLITPWWPKYITGCKVC